MTKITVKDTEVNVVKVNGEDYICLTDMMRAKDGDFFITDWLRNRNTLEFIGIWEKVYNPNFNYGEFATIRNTNGQFCQTDNTKTIPPFPLTDIPPAE